MMREVILLIVCLDCCLVSGAWHIYPKLPLTQTLTLTVYNHIHEPIANRNPDLKLTSRTRGEVRLGESEWAYPRQARKPNSWNVHS